MINSGNVIYWKLAANSVPDIIAGIKAVAKITTLIIAIKAIIRYLNFNVKISYNYSI